MDSSGKTTLGTTGERQSSDDGQGRQQRQLSDATSSTLRVGRVLVVTTGYEPDMPDFAVEMPGF
jgi:hypothetical protein